MEEVNPIRPQVGPTALWSLVVVCICALLVQSHAHLVHSAVYYRLFALSIGELLKSLLCPQTQEYLCAY